MNDQRAFVKICGLSEPRSVQCAIEAGADAIGFVLASSPRQVGPAAVRRLTAGVPKSVLTVAVFADEPTTQVRRAVIESGVQAVQLHGDHPAAHFTALADLDVALIRATSFGSHNMNGDPNPSPTQSIPTPGSHGEDLLILDSARAGSGETWDWASLSGHLHGPWLLAGGLSCENINDALTSTNAWGVDVSSGVERERGVKDLALISRFVRLAKAHAYRLTPVRGTP